MKVKKVKRSLKLRIFLITVGIFLFALMLTYGVLYIAFHASAEYVARRTAEGISNQVFSSMYQVMRKGWNRSDVMEFLRAIEVSYSDTPLDVNIFRGEKVKSLFGSIPEPEKSEEVIKAFKAKKKFFLKEDGVYKAVSPILARKECLKCHVNAKKGEVLGVIETKIDLSSMYNRLDKILFLSLFFLLPLNVLISFGVSKHILKTVKDFAKDVEDSINRIRNLEDLKKISQYLEVPYKELEHLYLSLNKLSEKIRQIAIDKDILELESKLLEKFIENLRAKTPYLKCGDRSPPA